MLKKICWQKGKRETKGTKIKDLTQGNFKTVDLPPTLEQKEEEDYQTTLAATAIDQKKAYYTLKTKILLHLTVEVPTFYRLIQDSLSNV